LPPSQIMVCRTVAFVGAAVVVFGLQDGVALVWAFVVSLGTVVFPAVAVVVAVLAFASISYTFVRAVYVVGFRFQYLGLC